MKIGVISDTHIPNRAGWLPEKLVDALKDTDLIVHAGDILDEEVIEYLKTIAPVKAVKGNMDPFELKLPRKLTFEVENIKFGVIHGDGFGGTTVERALKAFPEELDCIIFGHSHQAYQKYHGKTLMFNPGSPTDKRRSPKNSYGIIEVKESILKASIIYF